MLKTIRPSEFNYFLKFLKPYYEHMSENFHTMICQIYSLHEIKIWQGDKIK